MVSRLIVLRSHSRALVASNSDSDSASASDSASDSASGSANDSDSASARPRRRLTHPASPSMAGPVPVARSLQDIYTDDAVATQTTRWTRLLDRFRSVYDHGAEFVARSPGRVNIIGEHIDYSLYSVLPMAITADALLAVSTDVSATADGTFRIQIANVQDGRFPAHDFDIPYDAVDIDATVHEWTNYFKSGLRGALELLRKKHGAAFRPRSMQILMDGTVPAGGGLSSSAAFVSASALAVMVANGEQTVDKSELKELAIVNERALSVNSGGYLLPLPLRQQRLKPRIRLGAN